jgi:hypothetical protein
MPLPPIDFGRRHIPLFLVDFESELNHQGPLQRFSKFRSQQSPHGFSGHQFLDITKEGVLGEEGREQQQERRRFIHLQSAQAPRMYHTLQARRTDT